MPTNKEALHQQILEAISECNYVHCDTTFTDVPKASEAVLSLSIEAIKNFQKWEDENTVKIHDAYFFHKDDSKDKYQPYTHDDLLTLYLNLNKI